MKIALLDLNHSTRGIHTNTTPLGLGLISSYLKKNLNVSFDIKIFKDIHAALDTFHRRWIPDVVGLAQYSWNSELNLVAARAAVALNPDCLVIAGGPNIYKMEPAKLDFLKQEPYVDVCVVYDGEITFTDILRRLISGETKTDIRKNPEPGTYALNPETGELINRMENPPRLESLDTLGTPYADGFFDTFLDEGYHPFVQTHRGCPFGCAFCHTSDSYYNKMLFLSPELFRCDMEVLGKRFGGKYHIPLYIANTNWSLFDQDFEIARVIQQIKETYDWPHQIHINSGKNPKKLIEMLSIFRYMPGISLQTLTPHVLKNIKRVNIPFEDYLDFQEKVSVKTGRPSATELILSLPGETKETFMDTLVKTIDSGTQNIIIYTLMKLRGTPLNSDEFEKTYGYVVRHRVVPRQFSDINGTKIFDTEEVIVGTNTMSFDDYIELRSLSFTVSAFLASSELIPLVKLIVEHQIKISAWILGIHDRLRHYPDIYDAYQNFLQETRDELFPTREALVDFYSKPENYEALCMGKLGDNLLRKYKCIILFEHFGSLLDVAIAQAQKLMAEVCGEETANELLANMKRFLSTRNMKSILGASDMEEVFKERVVELDVDIPAWLEASDSGLGLERFKRPSRYRVVFPEKAVNELNDIVKMNKDLELSMQILYRDGTIRAYWPHWVV
ncbi:MAG: B12-binding domain-containing radical SAM protein [Candidatus Omnitrophota bacterium]